MSEEIAPGIGHNRPLVLPEEITAEMQREHAEMVARQQELLAQEPNLPTEITDDVTSGLVGDAIVQIKGHIKLLNTTRTGEKEPYLEGGRRVDGFFNGLMEPLKAMRDKLVERDTVYKEIKAEEERVKRQEEERIAREAAEEAVRVAREAERKAKEEAARILREKEEAEAARKAEEARRLKAEQDKRDAEEAQRKAEAEAEAAKVQKIKDDADRKIAEAKAAMLAEQHEAERVEREAKDKIERERAERQRVKDEEAAAVRARAAQRVRDREARNAAKEAERAQRTATKAARDATASEAELSRTRGAHGSVGGIRVVWKHDENSVDRKKLNLEALREHLPDNALHSAIRSWIKANYSDQGGKPLRGVKIYEDRATTYR